MYFRYATVPKAYKEKVKDLNIDRAHTVKFVKFAKTANKNDAFVYFVDSKYSYFDEIASFKEMPISVFCSMPKDNIYALIDKKDYPILCESLVNYSNSKRQNSKIERYLMAYKAYEGVTKKRDDDLTAIRHACAHQTSKLSQKKTIRNIKKIFGTVQIDLSKSRHNKIFYDHFVKLLLELDEILYKKVLKLLPNKRNLHGTYYHIHK